METSPGPGNGGVHPAVVPGFPGPALALPAVMEFFKFVGIQQLELETQNCKLKTSMDGKLESLSMTSNLNLKHLEGRRSWIRARWVTIPATGPGLTSSESQALWSRSPCPARGRRLAVAAGSVPVAALYFKLSPMFITPYSVYT